MSGLNVVTLVGRLVKDPELRYIPGSGTAVATGKLAIDRDYTKKDGSKDTDFIPIEVMGKSAEFMANYCGKGRLIALQGRIQVDNYQDQQGNQKTFTKVVARGVQALDSAKKDNNSAPAGFEPAGFEPVGLDPQGFQAIDDDDIPF